MMIQMMFAKRKINLNLYSSEVAIVFNKEIILSTAYVIKTNNNM